MLLSHAISWAFAVQCTFWIGHIHGVSAERIGFVTKAAAAARVLLHKAESMIESIEYHNLNKMSQNSHQTVFVDRMANNNNDLNMFDIKQKNNMVLYWGQGDKGEKRLSYYCNQPGVSVIVMGFIADYTGGKRKSPLLNLSSNCDNVENCEEVTRDIKGCQAKGIKVILSMGGAAGPYRTQTWDPDVLAWWVWNKFLGGDDRTLSRPFKDVQLDGIDFDPEGTTGVGYDQLIDTLRKLFKTAYPARDYLITAAPQCPDLDMYPMNAMYPLLHPNSKYNAYPDMMFVQFYNNYCSASSFNSRLSAKFNFDVWEKWSQKNTNGKTKIFLGLMGKENHLDTGYVNYEKLTEILDMIAMNPTFGGVMMWDARYAYSNPVSHLSGIQYGQAAAEYLDFLSRTTGKRTALQAFDSLGALKDTAAPLMMPISSRSVDLNSPLTCNGQVFQLMRSVSSWVLAESFGHSGEEIEAHLSNLGIPPSAPIVPGSRICLGKGLFEDTLAINYVYNASVITGELQPRMFTV